MVYRDVFVKEVRTDLRRCTTMLTIGVGILTVIVFYFARACWQSTMNYKNYVAASATGTSNAGGGLLLLELGDPSFDDNPVPAPTPTQDGADIPSQAAFAATMAARANDPDVVAFQQEVSSICDGSSSCSVDPGLGGGTAAAFDPAYDSYDSSSDDDDDEYESDYSDS